MIRIIFIILILFGLFSEVLALRHDSLSVDSLHPVSAPAKLGSSYRFHVVQTIIPASLIAFGFFGTHNGWVRHQNREIRHVVTTNIDKKFTVDDYSQYMPMLAVYGLNMCGVGGKHNLRDRTLILGTAAALMGITVNSLKAITRVERPDGSSKNSFPSGHTALAFMGAEFLRREYRDTKPWIGLIGYSVATGTGLFRMYNNRHWLTDVMAGAGIGILSTRAAYWLFPTVDKFFTKNSRRTSITILPVLTINSKGLYCQLNF